MVPRGACPQRIVWRQAEPAGGGPPGVRPRHADASRQCHYSTVGTGLVHFARTHRSRHNSTRCFLADDEEETFQYSSDPYAHYENATLALYNTTFREDLHKEPPWDADMAWLATQGPDDVKDMLKVQEVMLARCLDTSPDRDLFKYGGTAASVRDLVALADVLDGPGSSVNLWTKHYGSVLASHLLKSMRWLSSSRPISPVLLTITRASLAVFPEVRELLVGCGQYH